MAPWKRFFAKAAKSFENQCETEGARSHQSLWKPFRFWFVSLKFWDGVLALQSDTSWCQNWRSGATERQLFAFVFFCFFSDFAFLQAPARSAGAKKIKPGGARGGRRGGNPAGKAMPFFTFSTKSARRRPGPGRPGTPLVPVVAWWEPPNPNEVAF